MNWSLWVVMGAVMNVLNNWGYKGMAGKEGMLVMAGCVMGVASLVLLGYAVGLKGERLAVVSQGNLPWMIIGMGVASPLILICLLKAFETGPLSLVDPLWACVYALTSVVIGTTLLREAPSVWALGGVGFYLAGAFLMARG